MVVHGAQAWFDHIHSQVGLLTLPLRKFRVDGAQTPLTGHLPPPPHRLRVPKATGRMLQIDEPSMDGVKNTQDLQRLPPSTIDSDLTVSRARAVSAENVPCLDHGVSHLPPFSTTR